MNHSEFHVEITKKILSELIELDIDGFDLSFKCSIFFTENSEYNKKMASYFGDGLAESQDLELELPGLEISKITHHYHEVGDHRDISKSLDFLKSVYHSPKKWLFPRTRLDMSAKRSKNGRNRKAYMTFEIDLDEPPRLLYTFYGTSAAGAKQWKFEERPEFNFIDLAVPTSLSIIKKKVVEYLMREVQVIDLPNVEYKLYVAEARKILKEERVRDELEYDRREKEASENNPLLASLRAEKEMNSSEQK